jgi:phytoene desaturase (3,4-didehydrolycopene-forming)
MLILEIRYSLLQYTELAEGIWYPIGGFHKIIEGLVNVGKRQGVSYRLSSPIASITLSPDKRSATGVQLEDGEHLEADIVVCNADLIYTYNNLLPDSSHARSLSNRLTSCSSISFYWSLNRTVPELKTHNIFLADGYRESFDSIFKRHLIPDEPSFYVNVPSRIDPTAAPPNCDSIVVLVPVGHILSSSAPSYKSSPTASGSSVQPSQDWPSILARARSQVLSTMKARIGVDLAPLIIHEEINDPLIWKEKFNLDRGAILGLSHSFFNVLSFRPKTKHASIKGLYFVGASTHPGTGVPICLAGAKIVASQILADLGMSVPWENGGLKIKGDGTGIDAVQRPASSLIFGWPMILVIGLALAAIFLANHRGSCPSLLARDW